MVLLILDNCHNARLVRYTSKIEDIFSWNERRVDKDAVAERQVGRAGTGHRHGDIAELQRLNGGIVDLDLANLWLLSILLLGEEGEELRYVSRHTGQAKFGKTYSVRTVCVSFFEKGQGEDPDIGETIQAWVWSVEGMLDG